MSRVNQQSQKATIQLPIPVTVQGASPKTVPRPTPPSISRSKGKTYFYLKDIDTILFSATQTVCPFSSEIERDFTHDDPHLENLFQLRYDLSRYIQIAATPDDAELKYTGPLFQRLATIHIVSSGSTYSLSEEQKTSWKWLENTLYHAASTFSVDSLLPLEFAMLPLPSYYGYLRIHKKQCHALRCTRNSRLAFHSLVGLLNLFYGRALVRYESGRSGDPRRPLSPSETLSHSGLSQAHVCDIIDALQPEALGRCVGVVLDPTASTLGSILPWLNRIRVPVWIITGTSITLLESKSFKYHTFDIICPHGDEKLQLRALINKTIAADIKPGLSTIDPDSLHRWNALVDYRKIKREEFLSRASESIKALVKKRLQDAVNFIVPKQRDGTRFFMWYRSKQGRFRGELEYGDAMKEIKTRRKQQFVYDDISNQWDICSLFDGEQDPTQGDAAFDNEPLHEADPTPPPKINIPPFLSSDHNELGRTIVLKEPIAQDVVFGTSLEDVLYSRYGLLCATQCDIQSAEDFTPIEESRIVDTYTVRKYIMEVNLALGKKSNEFAIQYFISSLVLELQPPSIIWDLHPQEAAQLLELNEYFKVEQVTDRTLSGYFLLPVGLKFVRPWKLFLDNATSVVQCIREHWGPSLEDVILCLFERGIPFKLLSNVAYSPMPRPITVFESNRRPYGWKADKFEYKNYELRRNRLLRLPHVRVAVAQAGGILWRLCKQELANDIPNGPSSDVLYFADTSEDASCTLLFDTLSEHEIEILCGVYYVDTDRRAQTTTLAWWPVPGLWDASGLNTGYWTLSCEQLFQARLRKICEGEATLLTTKKWRSDLKYYKNQSKKINNCVENKCRQLLR